MNRNNQLYIVSSIIASILTGALYIRPSSHSYIDNLLYLVETFVPFAFLWCVALGIGLIATAAVVIAPTDEDSHSAVRITLSIVLIITVLLIAAGIATAFAS